MCVDQRILAILILWIFLAACQSTTEQPATKTAAQSEKPAASADTRCISETPLPDDLKLLEPGPNVPKNVSQFAGKWMNGNWNGELCGALVVNNVTSEGDAEVIYSWGHGISAAANYVTVDGKIKDGTLNIRLPWGTEAQYEMESPTVMTGKFFRNGVWTISLEKQ